MKIFLQPEVWQTIFYAFAVIILILVTLILIKVFFKIRTWKSSDVKKYKKLIENFPDTIGYLSYQVKHLNLNLYRLSKRLDSLPPLTPPEEPGGTGIKGDWKNKDEIKIPKEWESTSPNSQQDQPTEPPPIEVKTIIETDKCRFLEIEDDNAFIKTFVYSEYPSDFVEIERKMENNEEISIVTVDPDAEPIESSAQKDWLKPLFEFSGDLGKINVAKYAKVKWKGDKALLYEQGMINLLG